MPRSPPLPLPLIGLLSFPTKRSQPRCLTTLLSKPPTSKPTFSRIFQDCSARRDLDTGTAAHAHMVTSGFAPTTFVTNCLIHMYLRCSRLDHARSLFDRFPDRDVVSWNALVHGYALAGSLDAAVLMFEAMPERDIVSWNSMVSGFLQNRCFLESIDVFLRMGRGGMWHDGTTFAVALKSCSALKDCWLGTQIHGLTVRSGLNCDVMTGSALVDMYSKCGRLGDSMRFFHEMSSTNLVSWSAIIAGCVQNDNLGYAVELFKAMQREGIMVSQSIYASILRLCAQFSFLELGRQVHGLAMKGNFNFDTIVGTALLDMYAKCSSLEEARIIFESLDLRSIQSWNAMLIGLAQNDQFIDALDLFHLMNRSVIGSDEVSLSGALSACAGSDRYVEGLQVHGMAIKKGLNLNISVANACLDMYGKCKALTEACNVFDEMDRRDAVSWNAMIAAAEQNGKYGDTIHYYGQMLHSGMEPDEFTFGSVLKACGAHLSLDYGMKIHNRIIKSGLGLEAFVGGALVDMYCKCGIMDDAKKLHDRIEKQTMVSWNAIIAGFSSKKQSEESQWFFFEMLNFGVKPDNFTYASVLDTCANLAMVELGKQLHAQIIKQKLQRDTFISSTLVDMYSKCGNMQESLLTFEAMPEQDFVSWNAMISGYAQHGLGDEALKMFKRMKLQNVKPNHATFISVLRACGHVGLFDEGVHYFHSMLPDYGLEPELEHYSCMVDILGRAGRVNEALKLITAMPFEADSVIWRTLLSVCQIQGNMEVAELAARSILQMEPDDSSAYILLSNIYADLGKWTEVSIMRRTMRQNKLKKEPGCSWIEMKREVHTFLVGDKAHPRYIEIYECLELLIDDMSWTGYIPEVNILFIDEEVELDISWSNSRPEQSNYCLGVSQT